MQIEEVAGRIITRVAPNHPVATRRLLELAYSYVAQKRLRKRPPASVAEASERFNGEIAHALVRALKHPKRSVIVNIFMPCELLHALDVVPMFPEVLSVYIACTCCAPHFLDVAEAAGFPESLCSYHKATLGLCEAGILWPPAMIANTTLACDANNVTFRSLAKRFDVPHAVIDVPKDVSEQSVAYVKTQLVELAHELEHVFGTRLDMDRLEASVQCARNTLVLLDRYVQARAHASLATTLTSELCMLIATHCMLGTPQAETYMGQLLALTQNKSEITRDRARIFWVHTMPNWQPSLQALFDGVEARAELVGNDMTLDTLSLLSQLDERDPFDFMARRLMYCSANGAGTRRIETALAYAERLSADGVVLFGQGGCKQTLGVSELFRERATECGMPYLAFEGDGCDPRASFDGQIATRLEAFLEHL